ncbi:MAG: energy transducer TonB [Rhodocyclaceae bacterium]|nr:energy transducer TonB [Rhodocyclaceae bacterium]MBX3670055.1 energy transducer TonB [Rhodocyclaceae bacterium]
MNRDAGGGRLTLAVLASLCLHGLAVMRLPGLGDAYTPPRPLAVRLVELPAELARDLPRELPRLLPVAPAPNPAPKQHAPKAEPKAIPTPAPVPPAPTSPPVITNPAPATSAPAVPAAAPAVEAPKPAPAERKLEVPRTVPRYDAAYLSNPRPPYPRLSMRRGEQGTVKLRVLVTKEGMAGKVELEKSSGFEALDESALRTVAIWKFEPARRGNEALEEWFIVPIEFVLKSAGDAN